MFGSFLPSLWSSNNHSLLGSRSRHCYAIKCSWVDSTSPVTAFTRTQRDFCHNFRVADYPTRTPFKLCIGSCLHLPSQVLAETDLFMIQRDKQVHFCVCAGLRPSCSGRIRMANRGTLPRARHRTNTYKSPRHMGSYDRRICPRSGGPSAACGRRRRKTRTHRTAPRC